MVAAKTAEFEGPWLLNTLSGVAHKAIHVDGDEDTVFLACRPSATLHAAFEKRLENPWFEGFRSCRHRGCC